MLLSLWLQPLRACLSVLHAALCVPMGCSVCRGTAERCAMCRESLAGATCRSAARRKCSSHPAPCSCLSLRPWHRLMPKHAVHVPRTARTHTLPQQPTPTCQRLLHTCCVAHWAIRTPDLPPDSRARAQHCLRAMHLAHAARPEHRGLLQSMQDGRKGNCRSCRWHATADTVASTFCAT